MKSRISRALVVCVALFLAVIVQPSSLALTSGGSITALDAPLTENFNTLTSGTWTDNSTIPGWYSNRVAHVSGTGVVQRRGPL
jgi:hypothetical protein